MVAFTFHDGQPMTALDKELAGRPVKSAAFLSMQGEKNGQLRITDPAVYEGQLQQLVEQVRGVHKRPDTAAIIGRMRMPPTTIRVWGSCAREK